MNKLTTILAIVTTVSVTVNIIVGLRILDLPPDWLIHEVRAIGDKLDTHISEHRCK